MPVLATTLPTKPLAAVSSTVLESNPTPLTADHVIVSWSDIPQLRIEIPSIACAVCVYACAAPSCAFAHVGGNQPVL